MQRDRFTIYVRGLLVLTLGILLWRAWGRAGAPSGPASAAEMARAAAGLAASFLLLAALALAARWTAGGAPVRPRAGHEKPFLRLAALALAGTLVVGTSGAVSALDDGAEGRWEDLRLLHPLIAVAGSLVLLRLVSAVRQRRRRPGGPPGGPAAAAEAGRWANRLHLLVFAQLALGTLNTVLTASVWLELVHLLLADLVWIVVVLTCAASLASEEGGRP